MLDSRFKVVCSGKGKSERNVELLKEKVSKVADIVTKVDDQTSSPPKKKTKSDDFFCFLPSTPHRNRHVSGTTLSEPNRYFSEECLDRKGGPLTCWKPREEQVSDLADPEFTCAICSIQGHTRDEEMGIFWVGCDNTMTCNRWFHRDCLPQSEHAEVNLSVITGSTWHCHVCNIFAIAQDVETEDPATDVICQVCMASCTLNELEDGIDLFWIVCKCGKSFHKYCLPVTVYRQWDLAKDKWCCGQCPDDM